MNQITFGETVQLVTALVRGASVAGAAATVGIDPDTAARHRLIVGEACARLLDGVMRGIVAPSLQIDEMWGFVHLKEHNKKRTSPPEWGDQYIWIAEDKPSRAVVSWRVGRRDRPMCLDFLTDLSYRINGKPQLIVTDAFMPYREAVEICFGADVNYAQTRKKYEKIAKATDDRAVDDQGRKRHGRPRRGDRCMVGVKKVRILGEPDLTTVYNNHVERFNGTTRQWVRGLVRETLCFCKTMRAYQASVALHLGYYNFCHIPRTMETTPAMALGVVNDVWDVDELVAIALAAPEPPPLGGEGGPSGSGGPPQMRFPFAPPPPAGGRPRLTLIPGGLA